LIVIFCIPFFINLGSNSLWDGNEGFYAEPPREMIESGNYLIPTYNYAPRFKKPPFTSWIIGSSYYVFGVSEFAERLPIAIAAVLTIYMVYLFGRSVCDKETGFMSAIILATTLKFMIYARQFAGDIFLTLFITSSITYFARSMIEEDKTRKFLYLLLAYAAIGLGIIDKGLVAVVIPYAVIGFFILITRRWNLLRLLFSPSGFLVVFLIGTPWYFLMIHKYGWEFFKVNIVQETVMRYVSNQLGGRAVHYYIGVYFAEALPWSFFIVPAIAYWVKWLQRERRRLSKIETQVCLMLLPVIWFMFVFLFFSTSVGKRAVYLVPLYPAAAIVLGHYFSKRLTEDNSIVLNLHRAALVGLSMASLFAAAFVFFAHRTLEMQTALIYLPIVLLIVLGGSTIFEFYKRNYQPSKHIAFIWLMLLFSLTLILPKLEYYRPIPRFAEIIRREAKPGDPVGTFQVDTPSLMFYARRKIFQSSNLEEMLSRLDREENIYFVTRTDYYEKLQASTPIPLQVIDSQPLLLLRWETFFSKKKPLRLVLVKKGHF
jgi:4-amino-4-deoxy-L-arabinose transferase-like glycosyltransferase